jgi:hypothetical protein
VVPGLYDLQAPNDRDEDYMKAHPGSNRHETLTGSMPDGRAFTDTQDHTCNNWTSEAKGNSDNLRENTGAAGAGGHVGSQWRRQRVVDSAHSTTAADRPDLAPHAWHRMYYCFRVELSE